MRPLGPATFLSTISPRLLLLAGLASTLLLGIADYFTQTEMSFTLLYLVAIGFVGWQAGYSQGYLIAAASLALRALDQLNSRTTHPFPLWVLAYDLCSQGAVFGATAWGAARLSNLTGHLGEMVRQRKSQYEAMLATTMDGFIAIDAAGCVADVNEAYCRVSGYSREELIGMKFTRLEAKEGPKELAAHLREVRERGGHRFETRHRHKDGHEIDLEISASTLGNSKTLCVAFAREIGERKLAEERLRQSEARYRSLAESSPDTIFVLDRELRVRLANTSAAALWDCASQDLIGRSQSELFPPDIAIRHTEVAERAFATGEVVRYDELAATPTGERWVETRVVPVRGSDGKPDSLILIAVDISQRKQAEFLLEAQKELGQKLSLAGDLNTAVQALLDTAIRFGGVDAGGVYLRVPATGELTLVATVGQMTAALREAVSYYPGQDPRARLVAKGAPVYTRYSDLPREVSMEAGGALIRALAVIPMLHEGVVIGALNLASYGVDSFPSQSRIGIELIAAQAAGAISRIKAAAERQKLQDQLLTMTDREQARIGQEIHDGLCQHLVSLAFDANGLQQELARQGRPEELIAARIANYLDQSITDARQLARGLFPVRLESDGLHSALQELADSTTARFGVPCSVRCVEPLTIHIGDVATHLFRIAQEAVTNAVKHGHPSTITISLSASADSLDLEIEDNGVGLPTDSHIRGQGMGLQIMEYRARSIGATFRIASGQRGGTLISCCLPWASREKIGL